MLNGQHVLYKKRLIVSDKRRLTWRRPASKVVLTPTADQRDR
jgi:hypothetical protein